MLVNGPDVYAAGCGKTRPVSLWICRFRRLAGPGRGRGRGRRTVEGAGVYSRDGWMRGPRRVSSAGRKSLLTGVTDTTETLAPDVTHFRLLPVPRTRSAPRRPASVVPRLQFSGAVSDVCGCRSSVSFIGRFSVVQWS